MDKIRKWGLERTKKELGSMKYEITIGLSNYFPDNFASLHEI